MTRWIMMILIMVGAAQAAVFPKLDLFRLEGGEKVPFALKSETKYVALYQSASWCPPCRKTTPRLVEEYQRMLKMENMPVEIILVSGDRSEEDTLDYMKLYDMPWPAVEWASIPELNGYAAEGIPHLVLVEIATGKVITKGTGPSGVEAAVERMREHTGVTSDSAFKVGGFMDKYGLLVMVALSGVSILLFQKWREKRAAAK